MLARRGSRCIAPNPLIASTSSAVIGDKSASASNGGRGRSGLAPLELRQGGGRRPPPDVVPLLAGAVLPKKLSRPLHWFDHRQRVPSGCQQYPRLRDRPT